jgi:PPOX class probable F420-dependent enzyme
MSVTALLVLTTGAASVKGRNLRRDPRVAVVVDDQTPPFAFVHIRGRATLSEDLGELLRYATQIGGRYMGAERAGEFGQRNAVPPRPAWHRRASVPPRRAGS